MTSEDISDEYAATLSHLSELRTIQEDAAGIRDSVGNGIISNREDLIENLEAHQEMVESLIEEVDDE